MSNFADKYTYRVQWSSKDAEFIGLCSEFPSLSWLAESQEAAFRGILNLVHDSVAEMLDNNTRPPEPLSERSFSGKFLVRIPPTQHKRLVLTAQAQGISLNSLVNKLLA